MLANVYLAFIYCITPKNSLHHFPRVEIFVLVAFQLYLYMCAYVHEYTVYKHSSVLRQLLLYAANINLLRKFLLCSLLYVFFGCLFVALTSVFIVDITVDLENFQTIYTSFRCSAMCFLAVCYLGYAPIWRMCFYVLAKLCLGYFKT